MKIDLASGLAHYVDPDDWWLEGKAFPPLTAANTPYPYAASCSVGAGQSWYPFTWGTMGAADWGGYGANWWQIDLGRDMDIARAFVWVASAPDADRLQLIALKDGGTEWVELAYPPRQVNPAISVTFDTPQRYRYWRVNNVEGDARRNLQAFQLFNHLIFKGTHTGDGIYEILNTRKDNITSGLYKFRCNDIEYATEVVVVEGDTTLTANPNWGSFAQNTEMLVVVVKGDLTVNAGVTVTPNACKKGFVLFVDGKLTNAGNISMTARGANAEGQDVYLYKNKDGTYEYIPAIGAVGGDSVVIPYSGTQRPGIAGASGIGRQSGGGGSGAAGRSSPSYGYAYSGRGGIATSYSGGAGGGGCWAYNYACAAGAGSDTGGPGGNSMSSYGNSRSSGSGAGNPGGPAGYGGAAGGNGTGGLLVIFAEDIDNTAGAITSQGSNGGWGGEVPGGSSGGGSINVFYKNTIELGAVYVNGGAAVWGGLRTGGAGGNGTVTVTQIDS